MNIVICDDEALYRRSLHDSIIKWGHEHNNVALLSVREFSSSEDLLDAWENGFRADLLLLDIEMPRELSGLELARRIRVTDSDVLIAFITNYIDYACDGYEVDAVRYLIKPVRQSSVDNCLDLAWQRCRLFHSDSFTIQSGNQLVRISPRRITYIEVLGHVVTFHFSDREALETYDNLTDLLRKLPSGMVIQCHKSFAVNAMYISKLQYREITLTDGTIIPCGRKYMTEVTNLFNRIFLGSEEP